MNLLKVNAETNPVLKAVVSNLAINVESQKDTEESTISGSDVGNSFVNEYKEKSDNSVDHSEQTEEDNWQQDVNDSPQTANDKFANGFGSSGESGEHFLENNNSGYDINDETKITNDEFNNIVTGTSEETERYYGYNNAGFDDGYEIKITNDEYNIASGDTESSVINNNARYGTNGDSEIPNNEFSKETTYNMTNNQSETRMPSGEVTTADPVTKDIYLTDEYVEEKQNLTPQGFLAATEVEQNEIKTDEQRIGERVQQIFETKPWGDLNNGDYNLLRFILLLVHFLHNYLRDFQ